MQGKHGKNPCRQKPETTMNAIEIRGLTKYYDRLCAVDELTLSVDNEIFALLGPNGSGKTTTVLMLTTLLRPTKGTAAICGYDVARDGDKVRKALSYVPQEMAVDIRLDRTGERDVLCQALWCTGPEGPR